MKNIWILLVLTASTVFLSHCGGDDSDVAARQQLTEDAIGSSACIAGVYAGDDVGDVLWNYQPFDQDLTVSIAFSGDSALVQAKGEDGDVLCTSYQGIQSKPDEENEKITFITAQSLLAARNAGNESLAASFANSIQVDQSEEGQCNFSIGSFSLPSDTGDVRSDTDGIVSTDFPEDGKTAAVDYAALYDECSQISGGFVPVANEKAEAEAEAEAGEAAPAPTA